MSPGFWTGLTRSCARWKLLFVDGMASNQQEAQHAHEHRRHQQVVVAGHLADHDDGRNGDVGGGRKETCHADPPFVLFKKAMLLRMK